MNRRFSIQVRNVEGLCCSVCSRAMEGGQSLRGKVVGCEGNSVVCVECVEEYDRSGLCLVLRFLVNLGRLWEIGEPASSSVVELCRVLLAAIDRLRRRPPERMQVGMVVIGPLRRRRI